MKYFFLITVTFITTFLYSQNINIDGYEFKYELPIPEGYKIFPGQFSKDFTTYFLPMNDTSGNGIVYKYKISNSGKFKEDGSFRIKMIDDYQFIGGISVSEDEKYIVYCGTIDGAPENDDLFSSEFNYKYNKYSPSNPIGEVNDYEIDESSPCISPNGLNLYYISNNKIFFTKKKEGKSSFRFPDELDVDLSALGKIKSIRLSPDELELYIISNNTIYLATRGTNKGGFIKPKIYSDAFKTLGSISSFDLNAKSGVCVITKGIGTNTQSAQIYKKLK